MRKMFLILTITFASFFVSNARAQTVDWYQLFAVADAAAAVCSKGDEAKADYYRQAVYAAYLGKRNSEDLIAEEAAIRRLLDADPVGKAEYHSAFKEANSFLTGVSETETQKICQSILQPGNVPGFMQQPKN